MLLPAQVAPFLQHEHESVRQLALRYLSEAHDPSPATAEDVWRAIDRFGGGEYSRFYVALASMPQTEQSLIRTLKMLDGPCDQGLREHLERVFYELGYGLLIRFRDLIDASSSLSADLRQHLDQRIDLASTPAQELWDRLMQHAAVMSGDEPAPAQEKPDQHHAARLIEALARNPEAAQWAITTLNDPEIVDWREIYSVRLLGKMRHRPAVELLVGKLTADEDADVLIESSVDALVQIGSASVVQTIQQRFRRMEWGIRLHAADVLARIKLPLSEQALIALLDRESDRTMRTTLATALCKLAATEPKVLQRLREIVNSGQWDLTMTDLDADVAALFTMVGHDVPEIEQWRAQSSDQHARRKARTEEFRKLSPRATAFLEDGQDFDVETWENDAPAPQAHPQPAAASVPKPYRREAPKVGRNDPCPCGSGKKYKKCCGI